VKEKNDPPVREERADRSLKGRARDLAAKSLSIKIIIFVVGTGLLIWKKIDTWTWLALAAVVITGRILEKKTPWANNGK
jgi:hypothetical protein